MDQRLRESRRLKQPRRIPELDGVRGLAILLVLIWHFVGCTIKPGNRDLEFFIWKATSLTWCGVDIFFVLSGFLIGGILIDNRMAPHFFRTFYLRRAARIFPAYYAIVFVTFGLLALGIRDVPGSEHLFGGELSIWAYLLYVQNLFIADLGNWGFGPLGMTWSLAVEEQFYLLFPLVVRFTPVHRLFWVLVGGSFVGWLTRVALLHWHSYPELATYTLLPARCDALLIGALGAWLWRNKPMALDWLKDEVRRQGLVIALLAGCVFLTLANAGIGGALTVYFGHTWLALSGLVLIAISMVAPESRLAGLFRMTWLRWLGTISYTLYLVHSAVHASVFWVFTGDSTPHLLGWAGVLLTTVALALSLAVSSLSWKHLERPLIERIRTRTTY